MITIKKGIIISLFLFLAIFIASYLSIYSGVKNDCLTAKAEYGDDCVDALTQLVQDEEKSFWERNSAVWALGQLADKRSLSFLKETIVLLSEGKCDHDQHLCRRELEKAIKWSEKGSATSWMYQGRGWIW